jgi:hypothetical protein
MTADAGLLASMSDIDPVLADLVEELAARLQAGEAVDVDAYARRHPAHGERLRQLLPTVRLMAQVGGASGRGDLSPAAVPRPGERELGDFRLGREVGRGGRGSSTRPSNCPWAGAWP